MTSGERTSRWIRRLDSAVAAPVRLVCFPHAGGTASFFAPLAHLLSDTAEVLSVQYPGRQDRWREPCVESIEELADRTVEALGEWTNRPVALFGHSMGAAVAFEVALRLERQGTVPLGLYASGRRAPSLPRSSRRGHAENLDDETLLAELKQLDGSEAQVLDNDAMLRLILPAIRADYRAVAAYRHQGQQSLRTPVVVLVGESDPMVSASQARAWATHTSGFMRSHSFPGGHFYLTSQMDEVAAVVRTHLTPLITAHRAGRR